MRNNDIQDLRSAIAALEAQRATLGDAVLELATAPLRAQLAALLRPAGVQLRQVTVLFADVVGSTAMAQGLAAEDTLHVLGTAMHRMAAVVLAHQGRVLRFTGDGIKAAFGMIEAREDDAERAVRAGLALLEAGRVQAEEARAQHGVPDFAVRVGLHTGDVALGAGIDADNTAVGLAVNVAARMEQTALPGTLRISHDTWSQVRGLFQMDEQPPLMVKGVDAPMVTYLVRAALERSAASVERGLQGLATPMVGRDAELQRLLDATERARQSRQLQALTLIGDAGLGKSRLLREFTAALVAGTEPCQVMALRSQPDSPLRPWGLLRSLLALQCGVADTDSAEVAQRKVIDGLSPHFAERGERQAQLIGQLSGLDFADSPTVKGLDPRSLRDQALMALRAYLQALAVQGSGLPVLLVEDLHWADDSSLDLLQHLLGHAAELPLLLVMTARPALRVRRSDWSAPDTLVTLAPLPADRSHELLQALLHRLGEVPPRLSELITRRAEGNPYYMEELVRRLIDDGVIAATTPQWTVQADRLDALRLPTTLVGLLQARLDALPAHERQAVRQASVIGHVFWDDALQALDANAPQALPALQRAAFVKDRDTSGIEGTPERQFDHHLLHQVTYDTLLKAERKLGHGAAARWLQANTQGRGAEFLAMTGEHAERAGETALAIDCFEQAGTQAQMRFANTASVHWLRRAVGLLGNSAPKRRFDLLEQMEQIGATVGDRPAQDAAQADMAVLLDHHPDDACQARLLYCRALLAERRGDGVASERHVRLAIQTAEQCAQAAAAARSLILLGWLIGRQGDPEGALAHFDAALSWARQASPQGTRDDLEERALMNSGPVLVRLRRFGEARRISQLVLSAAEARGSVAAADGALALWIYIDSELGHFEQIATLAERRHALAASMGSVPRMSTAMHQLGEAKEALGEYAAAVRCYEDCLPGCRATGNRVLEGRTLFNLGRVHLDLGDAAAALRWHMQAQGVYETLEPSLAACENRACVALCQIRLGQPDGALALVNKLLEQLNAEWAQEPPDESIILRWTCQQALEAMADARAALLLQQLFADVQARAAAMTDAADRDRLIQAHPELRAIVAAWSRAAATRST